VGGILPVGGAAVVLLAAALVGVAFGRLPALRVGRWGAVLVWTLVLLVVWTGATVWWSIVADRSWDTFNKGVAYTAFLGLGVVLGLWLGTAAALRRSGRIAGALLVYVATLALALTLSRAGVVVGAGVLVLWFALASERVQSGLLLVAAAGPAAVVAGWAFTR